MTDSETIVGVLRDLILGGYFDYLLGFAKTCRTLYFPEPHLITCSGMRITHYSKVEGKPDAIKCFKSAKYEATICRTTDTSQIQCHDCLKASTGEWFKNRGKLRIRHCDCCYSTNKVCQLMNEEWEICSACWICGICYSRKDLIVNIHLTRSFSAKPRCIDCLSDICRNQEVL